MKIGLFDHLERVEDRTLATQFDERLEFVAAADEAGFYCLHVAEHHSSRLNMVPEPSVWLAAVARETKQIRMGPLVYLLTLYSPLRLAEEICMLDHLSKGRLELGVGRGVSPFELNFHKIDHDESREIFFDAYDCLKEALTNDEFSYEGKYFSYSDVPMTLRPLQQPYPPVWYGSSNTIGATWAGEQGLHFAANGATELALENITSYRTALAKRGAPAHPKPEFSGGGAIGLLRHIYVAETDEEALRIAKPALEYHAASLNWLRERVGGDNFAKRTGVHRGADFESWADMGMAIAGSPETVRAKLEEQIEKLGINYLIGYLFFGTMSLEEAMRSQKLFVSEIMPHLEKI
ncbi:MAG: LLM class flavin-dependent oxidoreductase [Rhodospirillaceae bacterium]|jgi:alkanesulfonate monooxygenase SsuD/methylene tetrahydromethanopterin reductase-like flavin-dependent oxidoreductase (luciferase family)|nr:LLM class flavin-dependent oxidoreductase [Rhodospirillaceae bacterium]